MIASSGKEAAYRVRYFPRVKHDRKDAIISVKQISHVTVGVRNSRADSYFNVRNSSEQRRLGAVDPQDIRDELPRHIAKRTRNVDYIIKRSKILERHYDKMLSEAIYG